MEVVGTWAEPGSKRRRAFLKCMTMRCGAFLKAVSYHVMVHQSPEKHQSAIYDSQFCRRSIFSGAFPAAHSIGAYLLHCTGVKVADAPTSVGERLMTSHCFIVSPPMQAWRMNVLDTACFGNRAELKTWRTMGSLHL